jgi:hypothetical protein
MRVLIAGWFSFDDMGATAGDIIARDIVSGWLQEINIQADIAGSPLFPVSGGVDWTTVEPAYYTDILFVCGPFGNGWPVTEMLERFAHCRLIGVNLSLMQSLEVWNPFALLLERDSSAKVNPDITLSAPPPAVPVVGIILAHKQKEYGARALHEKANEAIEELLSSLEVARVRIDTALLDNSGGLRTAGEVESLIAKMDLVITTRLHGTVLALKNGVPVIPIDPISGGAKITSQVKCIGWPVLFNASHVNPSVLREAFDYCLTTTAKLKAGECAAFGRSRWLALKGEFMRQLLNLTDKKLAYGA